MVNIGLIGCGKIAERHLGAYAALDGVAVTLYDVDTDAAARRAHEFGLEMTASLEELLSRPDIDAVDICAPTPWHCELVVAALARDKHVFCEKPLCATRADARAIHTAAVRSHGRLMVGYPYRFYPAIQYVKQVLDAGVIGRPHLALLRLGGRGDAAAWKHRQATGGGAILEMMVHELDMAYWFFGSLRTPRVLYKRTLLRERRIGQTRTQADAEDCVLARLEAGPVQILCEADLATPSYMNHFEIQGENGSIFSSMLDYLPTQVFLKQARGGFSAGATTRTFAAVNVF
jgi:predicted dehydrogenase